MRPLVTHAALLAFTIPVATAATRSEYKVAAPIPPIAIKMVGEMNWGRLHAKIEPPASKIDHSKADLGKTLMAIRMRAIAGGMKLLSLEEINEELEESRRS